MQIIISHFDQFPLITEKQADYVLWKSAYDIIQNKEHLSKEGLHKILAIRASLNKGLTPELKAAFPHVIPIERSLAINKTIKDPNWLAGFTSGEGCFYIRVFKSNTTKKG